jgi:hypothetical protein
VSENTAESQTSAYRADHGDDHNQFPATAKHLADIHGPTAPTNPAAGPLPCTTATPEPDQVPPGSAPNTCYSRFHYHETRIANRIRNADQRISGPCSYTFCKNTLQKEWAQLSPSYTNRYGNFCNRDRARLLFDLYLVIALNERFGHTSKGVTLRARRHALINIVSTF